MRDAAAFILLDDARPGGGATLYRDPLAEIVAHDPPDIRAALYRARAALAVGHHVAGYLAYAAASGLEPRATTLPDAALPPLWFGIFAVAQAVDAASLLPDPAAAWAGAPRPRIDRTRYAAKVSRVQALIAAGDIYQANLSFRADVPFVGDPLALYARLRASSAAGWGAIVRRGGHWLLSLSPEQFFTVDEGRLAARPMKGTRPRGADRESDDALAAGLAADAKDRAENLMIVDLLRNDLSRVAQPGSVRVPSLFAIETYPTIHQMVSEVEATLDPACDAVDALTALFPCGSITGAPKLRAMEVIAEVEEDARGVYTGAIGALRPDGSAAFNVAIRTLEWQEGETNATLGLGSAIVADSRAGDEWRECLDKARFVTAGMPHLDLIETMRFDPLEGVLELERHLARLRDSAAALGFAFDRHDTRNELHAATFRTIKPARIRLRLAASGATAIEVTPLPPLPVEPVPIRIVPLPVDPGDFRLVHKTSDRAFYDDARAAAGTFEVLFARGDGQLTEGSFTNLFVPGADGILRTPPRARGLLPGVLRGALIEQGRAIEAPLVAADLAGAFYIGNALRGLIAARLA